MSNDMLTGHDSDRRDHSRNRSMPAGDGLTANIIRFADVLRQAGIPVFFSSVLDALKSLPALDLSEGRVFFLLLRCLFVCQKEHLAKFDALFREFWLSHKAATDTCPLSGGTDDNAGAQRTVRDGMRLLREFADESLEGNQGSSQTYSPLASKVRQQGQAAPSEPLYIAMAELLAHLTSRLSRRYRQGPSGRRLCLSRLMRRNLRFGGELLLLNYKRRKVKQRPLVVFCDVSGSMDVYTLMAFQFIHVLLRSLSHMEIFFFSTELTRVTACFKQRDFSQTMAEVARQVPDWKGGTRIGYCLKQFNDTYGRRWLLNRALVMVFSDGWDRGEIDLLGRQMALLKRKVFKILWLNPLMGTRGYQPICQGMRAALPSTDYFLAAGGLHDFRDTGHLLEKLLL